MRLVASVRPRIIAWIVISFGGVAASLALISAGWVTREGMTIGAFCATLVTFAGGIIWMSLDARHSATERRIESIAADDKRRHEEMLGLIEMRFELIEQAHRKRHAALREEMLRIRNDAAYAVGYVDGCRRDEPDPTPLRVVPDVS